MVGVSKFRRNSKASIGSMIKTWDNQLDNSVAAFDKLFGSDLEYDKSLEVQIGELFTTNGRILKINGNDIPYIFKTKITEEYSKLTYDVTDKHGNFIKRYTNTKDIANFYKVTPTTIRAIARGDSDNNKLGIRIIKRYAGELHGTLN